MKVWVVLGSSDEGDRYLTCVVDSAEKAAKYDDDWHDIEQVEVE
jgi:hypothetical protein